MTYPSHLNPDTIHTAEQTLTRRELEAWRLSEYGFGHRTIAHIVGVSPTTVRDTTIRARRKLRRALDEQEGT